MKTCATLWPRTVAIASLTRGAPVTPLSEPTPEDRTTNAVKVQMIIVSIKTESIWTRPCLAGCDTEAEAAAFGAEPTPASFE